jgi:SAM-dependent methyltransferase
VKPAQLVRSTIQAARSEGLEAAYAFLHERVAVNWIERVLLGISTESHIPGVGMGRFNGVCLGYVPTSYRNLRAALRLVELKPSDVLLDFGCGLGRVVIDVARRHRIKRVIGIDLSGDFVEIARRNIATAQKKLVTKIDVAKIDAANFVIPDDVTIAFLFNPFHGHVLDSVLKNLRHSLDRNPRELRIICVVPPHGGTPFLDQVTRSESLKLVRFRELLGGWKCLLFKAAQQ